LLEKLRSSPFFSQKDPIEAILEIGAILDVYDTFFLIKNQQTTIEIHSSLLGKLRFRRFFSKNCLFDTKMDIAAILNFHFSI
jgi:hypothetical protein